MCSPPGPAESRSRKPEGPAPRRAAQLPARGPRSCRRTARLPVARRPGCLGGPATQVPVLALLAALPFRHRARPQAAGLFPRYRPGRCAARSRYSERVPWPARRGSPQKLPRPPQRWTCSPQRVARARQRRRAPLACTRRYLFSVAARAPAALHHRSSAPAQGCGGPHWPAPARPTCRPAAAAARTVVSNAARSLELARTSQRRAPSRGYLVPRRPQLNPLFPLFFLSLSPRHPVKPILFPPSRSSPHPAISSPTAPRLLRRIERKHAPAVHCPQHSHVPRLGHVSTALPSHQLRDRSKYGEMAPQPDDHKKKVNLT